MPRSAWGYTIFADDVRSEVGGKISIMGIYHSDMLVQSDFPITVAKFFAFVTYFEEKGAFKGDPKISLFIPGVEEPFFHATVLRSQLNVAPTPYADELETDAVRLLMIQMPILFSPLQVQQEGFVRVQAECDGTLTRLGRLKLRKARPEDNVTF